MNDNINEFMMTMTIQVAANMPDRDLLKLVKNDLSNVESAINNGDKDPWKYIALSVQLLLFKSKTKGDIQKTKELINDLNKSREIYKKGEDIHALEEEMENISKGNKDE